MKLTDAQHTGHAWLRKDPLLATPLFVDSHSWTPNLRVARPLEVLKVGQVERVEDGGVGFSRRHEVHVVQYASTAHAAVSRTAKGTP